MARGCEVAQTQFDGLDYLGKHSFPMLIPTFKWITVVKLITK